MKLSERQNEILEQGDAYVVLNDGETYCCLRGCKLILIDSTRIDIGDIEEEIWKLKADPDSADCLDLAKIIEQWNQG